MADDQRAKELAVRWGLSVRHALYRKTGNWYHKLKEFPGALLDADGYVIFESEQEFNECQQLRVRKQVHAPKGIKAIPGYSYKPGNDDELGRLLGASLIRPRMPATGQGWGGSVEGRRAIETYAMGLAKRHYAALWLEVIDVSGTEPFDLLCRGDNSELRVEVKGTTSRGHSILLTRNEVLHARANNGRVALFVVSEISANASEGCSGGKVKIHEPWDICLDELVPIAFECRLHTGAGSAIQ